MPTYESTDPTVQLARDSLVRFASMRPRRASKLARRVSRRGWWQLGRGAPIARVPRSRTRSVLAPNKPKFLNEKRRKI
jgi:hypothetical protein